MKPTTHRSGSPRRSRCHSRVVEVRFSEAWEAKRMSCSHMQMKTAPDAMRLGPAVLLPASLSYPLWSCSSAEPHSVSLSNGQYRPSGNRRKHVDERPSHRLKIDISASRLPESKTDISASRVTAQKPVPSALEIPAFFDYYYTKMRPKQHCRF